MAGFDMEMRGMSKQDGESLAASIRRLVAEGKPAEARELLGTAKLGDAAYAMTLIAIGMVESQAKTVGWQCPVCGGGVAPTVERCPCVAASSVPHPTFSGVGGWYVKPGSIRSVESVGQGGPGVASGGGSGVPISPKPADDGWIEWKGGHGLDTDKTVVAKLRDGRTIKERGNRMDWAIHGHADDIVAYKVLP